MTFLFVWIDLIVLQLKLIYNALSTDKPNDDLKEMKMEIRTISEKLQSQMTLRDEGIVFICLLLFYWTLRKSEIRE